jgi:hypothetical protein
VTGSTALGAPGVAEADAGYKRVPLGLSMELRRSKVTNQ